MLLFPVFQWAKYGNNFAVTPSTTTISVDTPLLFTNQMFQSRKEIQKTHLTLVSSHLKQANKKKQLNSNPFFLCMLRQTKRISQLMFNWPKRYLQAGQYPSEPDTQVFPVTEEEDDSQYQRRKRSLSRKASNRLTS